MVVIDVLGQGGGRQQKGADRGPDKQSFHHSILGSTPTGGSERTLDPTRGLSP